MSTGRMRTIAVLGGLIAFLGAWGAIVAYVGPLFNYPMPPGSDTSAFEWTARHWQLHLVPGAATMIGGFLLMGVVARGLAVVGGLLALVAGVWFIVGNEMQALWLGGAGGGGGGPAEVAAWVFVATRLGYHDGTGLLIATLAALALGLLAFAHRDRRILEERHDERAVEREPEYVA